MAVGIDVGSKTIKVIELAKDGNSFKLSGSGVVGYKGNLPEKCQEGKELTDLAQELFVGDQLRLAVVGPVDREESLEELLKL